MKIRIPVSVFPLLGAALLAFSAQAEDKTAKPAPAVKAAKAAPGKGKYLVIAPHQPEDCMDVMDDLSKTDKKLLSQIEWGCMDSDHTGYLLVDADSKEAAVKKLPEKERTNARAIKMTKFTPAQIQAIHEKMMKK